MVPLPGAAFTVLLVLIGAGSTGHGTVIPDPQNVELTCVDQAPIVQWDYSPTQPQTTFRVYIEGSAGNRQYETTDHEFDLRQFVWESEDQYMAYHTVTVTAIMEGKQSKPMKTKSFSFNQRKAAEVTCHLDFPPVNLTVDGSEATVSFLNPFSFFPELKRAHKPDSASFWFKVSVLNASHESRCGVDQKICRYDFEFPDDAEACIKLRGWLLEGNEVGSVEFREKDRVCRSSTMGFHWGVVVLMLVVFVVVIIIITFIVFKTGAWVLKTPPLPDTLLPPDPNSRDQGRYSPLDSSVVMSRVEVADLSPLVNSMEEEEASPTAGLCDGGSGPGTQNPPGDPFYMEGGFSDSSSSQEGTGLMSDGQRTDDDSANGSVETDSVSMSSTEEEESPYDRPHILRIDMGDGDTVRGYNTS